MTLTSFQCYSLISRISFEAVGGFSSDLHHKLKTWLDSGDLDLIFRVIVL